MEGQGERRFFVRSGAIRAWTPLIARSEQEGQSEESIFVQITFIYKYLLGFSFAHPLTLIYIH